MTFPAGASLWGSHPYLVSVPIPLPPRKEETRPTWARFFFG
jgi:hypothetical protein